MARWVTVKEAATALGVSEITLKRRIKTGAIPARKESSERGFKWFIEVADGRSQPQQTDVERQLSEIISLLKDELAARRREVAELHVVIEQLTRQQPRQLEAARSTSGPISPEVAPDRSWWRRFIGVFWP